jgi:hypothetical protein
MEGAAFRNPMQPIAVLKDVDVYQRVAVHRQQVGDGATRCGGRDVRLFAPVIGDACRLGTGRKAAELILTSRLFLLALICSASVRQSVCAFRMRLNPVAENDTSEIGE